MLLTEMILRISNVAIAGASTYALCQDLMIFFPSPVLSSCRTVNAHCCQYCHIGFWTCLSLTIRTLKPHINNQFCGLKRY